MHTDKRNRFSSAFRLIALIIAGMPFAVAQTLSAPHSKAEIDKQVKQLIERMVHRRTEHKAFSDLENLGCPAVPAIIARMDDRRRLPDPSIALRNKSKDAFEDKRFYGPEKVVDALAAILNQITGQDFGFIYNGDSITDAERTQTVQGWREFLSKTPVSKLCD